MQALAYTPAIKSQFESQLKLLTQLTHQTYDSMRKLSELNLHTAQQMFEDSMNVNRQLLACSDPFQWTSAVMNQIQPATERIRNYQHELMGMLAGAQAEMSRTSETLIPEAGRAAAAVADEMARRGTEESEKLAARQRSTLDTMSAAYGGSDTSRH